MIKSYYLNDFTYKGKKYKFKKPLRVRIESFLCQDFKTTGWELNIVDVEDGFTRVEPIDEPEKEIKKFIKNIFDNVVSLSDNELSIYDKEYKQRWLNLIQPPKKKEK